jgi:eukaryotic-like serine/threonine-protein kinase
VLEDPLSAVARLQRARALARAGHGDEARAAYDDVLALWADADADVPLVMAARRERAG